MAEYDFKTLTIEADADTIVLVNFVVATKQRLQRLKCLRSDITRSIYGSP